MPRIGGTRASSWTPSTSQRREALIAAGGTPERIYVNHGRSGTNRARLGLEQAIAGCWADDTLVVTKLAQLARLARSAVNASTPQARSGLGLDACLRLRRTASYELLVVN